MTRALIMSYGDRIHGSLKHAEAKLIADVGGVVEAAHGCRLGKSRLSDCANPHRDDDHLPVDVVRSLERQSHRPVVTAHLAHAAGFLLVRIGRRDAAAADWQKHKDRLTKECCEAVAMAAEAVADGEITKREAGQLVKELDDALLATMALRRRLLDVIEPEREAAA